MDADDDCVLESGVPNVLHVRDGLVWTGPEAGFPRLQSMFEWRSAYGVVARAALGGPELVEIGGEISEEDARLDAELAAVGALPAPSSVVEGEREVRRRSPWLAALSRHEALHARGHRIVSVGFSRNAMVLSRTVFAGSDVQSCWVLRPGGGPLGLPKGAFEACWIDRVLRALDPTGPGQPAIELAQWLAAPVPRVAIFRSRDEVRQARAAVVAMERADVERVALPSGRIARRLELPPYEERVYDTDPLERGARSRSLPIPRRVVWWLG